MKQTLTQTAKQYLIPFLILVALAALAFSARSLPLFPSPTSTPTSTATPTATPSATPTPIPPTDTPTATITATPLVSVDGGMSATLALSNLSNRNIQVFWINFEGEEELYKRLSPGQAYDQETFVGHIWRVRDEASGEIVEEIDVKSRDTNMPIMVAGDLGPTLEPTLTPTPGVVVGSEGCQITDVPSASSSYYDKTCSYGGIEILASEKVDDGALKQAWNIVANMLAPRPDITETLSNRGLQVLIYPVGDPNDLPEMSRDDGSNAAGMAQDGVTPWISTGEGNLLCWSGAEMRGYNLLVHELAHQAHYALRNGVDPDFDKTLSALYGDAISAGKWSGHYAATNEREYWAEGVVMYLDASPINYENHYVNTKAELQEYDPDLYALIEETFRAFSWSPSCP
jgi:alpha-glucosidase